MKDAFVLMKKNKYIEFSMLYGIATLCFLVKHHERNENYEECAIIIDAIDNIATTLNEKLPTTIEKAVIYHSEQMQSIGFDGLISRNNMPMYAGIVLNEMNLLDSTMDKLAKKLD